MVGFNPHDVGKLTTTKDQFGYVLCYLPHHPRAQKSGYVPRAHLVMENQLCRSLQPHEKVWHINNNPEDDTETNLSMTRPRVLPVLTCPVCGKKFQQMNQRVRYCSTECAHVDSHRCKWPSKERLQWLVWSMPTEDVGAKLGVSGKAVEKWCKKLGVNKPGRGYWAKVHAGTISGRNPYKEPKD